MLLRYLTRYWYVSRKSYRPYVWFASVLRSLRVLRWPREHRELLGLDIVRRYIAADADADVFHHLSHRDYLSRHFTAAQRVNCMLSHYRFENTCFDDDYRRSVYGKSGLLLWALVLGGHQFSIRLTSTQRYLCEGDLSLILYLDDEPLHRISFSWVDAAIAGSHGGIAPFIARNQGRWRGDMTDALYATFASVFPHQWPAYFCTAAMRGVAAAVGSPQLLCVRSEQVLTFAMRHGVDYPAAYDGFWDAFGGVRSGTDCHVIPLPFRLRPCWQLASKHRGRAVARSERWESIAAAVCASLRDRIVLERAGAEHHWV